MGRGTSGVEQCAEDEGFILPILGIDMGAAITTIDSVTYDELNGWPIAKGFSIELRDTTLSAVSNDTASNGCLATGVSGSTTDKGSPGAASSGC